MLASGPTCSAAPWTRPRSRKIAAKASRSGCTSSRIRGPERMTGSARRCEPADIRAAEGACRRFRTALCVADPLPTPLPTRQPRCGHRVHRNMQATKVVGPMAPSARASPAARLHAPGPGGRQSGHERRVMARGRGAGLHAASGLPRMRPGTRTPSKRRLRALRDATGNRRAARRRYTPRSQAGTGPRRRRAGAQRLTAGRPGQAAALRGRRRRPAARGRAVRTGRSPGGGAAAA
jgi:hypothetical protein